MLKILIIFTVFLNIAFAKDRFTESDKERFLIEVKQEIAEHKLENKGLVDLQIIKPGFYAELENYLKQEKFTRDEMLKIKQSFENLTKNPNITSDKAEESFYNFINTELNEINSRVLEKIKEGKICNNWSCDDNLSCAPDPIQVAQGKLKKAGARCNENLECVSSECVEAKVGSKDKICEDVYRCFRPLSIGESCMENPVCGRGLCLPYNSLTSGIGECSATKFTCKKNNDCCSNSCSSGRCVENYICKDCVPKGAKTQRGQKCCEGLYENDKGICIPDVPPSVILQVLNFFSDLFISSANAELATPVLLGDEGAFLEKGSVKDNVELEEGVRKNFKSDEVYKSKAPSAKLMEMSKNKPKINFEKKSDFTTCDIHFREDFFNAQKKDNTFDLEMAMLGFDFVITGDSDKDFWTVKGVADSSIHSRLKKIGMSHKKIRAELNKKIEETDKKITCMCLDVQGYDQIKDSAKKQFFSGQCSEYAKYLDPSTSFDELSGDASGLKAKRLLVAWTQNLIDFNLALSVDNSELSKQILEVSNWANSSEAKWSSATTENFDLFKFSVQNPSGRVAGMGALVGALLAAGVIAILGGFATTSILSAWATAGIISATAATGAGGLWMIASLKGAWITQRPEITDNHIAPRSYSCGKKQTCMEFTRTLVQPFNDVCKIHTSSNACLKSFVVINLFDESNFIVDPWIPAGVSKDAILKQQPIYTEKMEEAFKNAKSSMMTRKPEASGGGGKKGGGSFVSESYLSEVFIDAELVGKYVPALGLNLEATYFMDASRVKLIKDAAKNFAISEGVLLESETDNLEAFANYAYENHFIWPKISSPGEISYPTVGLQNYLVYMANDVSGNLSVKLGKAAIGLSNLNIRYYEDYKNTLNIYSDAINQTDSLKSTLLGKELDKVKKDLDGLITMNAMLNNTTLDKDLSKLTPGFIENQSKIAGANSVVDLTSQQKKFIQAVGDLRLRRKMQLKALDTYQRAMTSKGDKDRTAKMATVSKAFNDKFTTKNGSYSGSSIGKSSASSPSSTNNSSVGAVNKNDKDSTPSSMYTNAYYGNGGSSRNSSASGSNASDNSITNSANNEAEAKLAEAIDARNSAKKEKYESNEGLTLFEKVTNAYIRNYDKVLTKRKDKDVVEER